MTTETGTGDTLRDTLTANYEAIVGDETVTAATEPVKTEVAKTEAEAPATEDTSKGRTAGRARDEQGRLLPGKAQKDAAAESPKADTPAKTEAAQPATAAAPAAPTKPYPSSWKKDYAEKWGALPPEVQDEIIRRESDYARGVSTYKAEYDRVKPLDDVLKQYQPFLQQANLTPEKFVHALAQTDQVLRYGAPEQKLQAFAKFAQDYQIPLHQLLIQGEDGKVYLNQQYFREQQQPAQSSGISPQEVDRLVQARFAQAERDRQIRDFLEAKDGSGNPLYPHFDRVKGSMDGLLRSGLYKDLPSAYKASLRLPEHAELYEAEQTAERVAKEKAQAAAKAAEAARARASTVSTRSQAPTGAVTSAKTGKGLRDILSASYDEAMGSGRV